MTRAEDMVGRVLSLCASAGTAASNAATDRTAIDKARRSLVKGDVQRNFPNGILIERKRMQ